MMPLACLGSPQDTLTEVVVSSLKWMKLGALGAFGGKKEWRKELACAKVLIFMKAFVHSLRDH